MINAQFRGLAGAKMPHFYSNPTKQGVSVVNTSRPPGIIRDRVSSASWKACCWSATTQSAMISLKNKSCSGALESAANRLRCAAAWRFYRIFAICHGKLHGLPKNSVTGVSTLCHSRCSCRRISGCFRTLKGKGGIKSIPRLQNSFF